MAHLVLYQVLRDLGVREERALAAAGDDAALVTKDYLKGELEALKNSLLVWTFSMLFTFATVVVAATAAIVKWVRP